MEGGILEKVILKSLRSGTEREAKSGVENEGSGIGGNKGGERERVKKCKTSRQNSEEE